MGKIEFLGNDGSFMLEKPDNYSYLYFPVAGEKGIKSAVTPNLGGDSKIGQNAFIMEPVSAENLHNNRSTRNFWCVLEKGRAWSATGASAEVENEKFTDGGDESRLEAGLMWHRVLRESKKYGLKSAVTSFAPNGHDVEIMEVEIENTADGDITFTPIAAIPIYGRSADNIRDHRHVTSLLHRIRTTDCGVYVKPTLSFDERGHGVNKTTYFVCGITGDGKKPVGFYPSAEEFIGEGGTYTRPRKIYENDGLGESGSTESYVEGREALGGICFGRVTLGKGEGARFTLIIGATEDESGIDGIVSAYSSAEKVAEALSETKKSWQEKVNVSYHTGDNGFDNFMRWVSFQPMLRRIYGCSFLPHHDYGRGGRGWRDLWQDCLSLLIMDPGGVRQMIVDNYGGVRIDGTNATIIGDKQGEFIADRNGIARVWMDHGLWPFITTNLYIGQTGDVDVLKEDVAFFKDAQTERGQSLDDGWSEEYGLKQKNSGGEEYRGSILEHILLQHLCAYYEIGAHGHMRLRGADWNDALDMAAENGESVAFTCAYAGNLGNLADLLETLEKVYGWESVELNEEMQQLLEDGGGDSLASMTAVLEGYLKSVRHEVSGKKVSVRISGLVDNLRKKADWVKNHVRETEWIDGPDGCGWFNSYYDNDGGKLESCSGGKTGNGADVKMMLTGQVFSVMSGTAKEDQVKKICDAADRFLYDRNAGGYRLNTDFKELKLNMGRMYGFSYGDKENGAVFSHMTVMYANALYQRGFVREGYKALQTLADTALDFEVSKIYPGIPEYFNKDGRGMYHYLTGAASWYMLTMVTEVFGVRGEFGNMAFDPKLVKEQFDSEGKAVLGLVFAGREFEVTYENEAGLDFGGYAVKGIQCDGRDVLPCAGDGEGVPVIARKDIEAMGGGVHKVVIRLA